MTAVFAVVVLVAVYAVTSELAIDELLSPASYADCCRRLGQKRPIPLTLAEMAKHISSR
jgi:hypothetical protein